MYKEVRGTGWKALVERIGKTVKSAFPVYLVEPGDMRLTGSIPEYQWLSTDAAPTPAAGDRAFGVEVNATTHAITVKYWTGAAWQEVA